MKLISAHIEGFGCLTNAQFNFEEDLSVFQEPNGYGKSTLAAFVRALLYGLQGSNKRKNILENPRKRYKPWNSTAYGGYLIFEEEGVRYRVTRTFGKTAAGDTCAIAEEQTGKLAARFETVPAQGELGEALFGLDEASFNKCVFYDPRTPLAENAYESLQQRLLGMVEVDTDTEGYETAHNILHAESTKLEGSKIKLIPVLGGEIAECQTELDKRAQDQVLLEETLAQINAGRAEAAHLQKEITAQRDLIQKESARASVAALLNQRANVAGRVQAEKAALQEVRSAFGEEVPGVAHAQEAARKANELRALQEAVPTLAQREQLENQVAAGERLFGGGEKAEADIAAAEAAVRDLAEYEKQRIAATMAPHEVARWQDLQRTFAQGLPTEAALQKVQGSISQVVLLQQQNESLQLTSEEAANIEVQASFFDGAVPSEETIKQHLASLDAADVQRKQNEELNSQLNEVAGALVKATEEKTIEVQRFMHELQKANKLAQEAAHKQVEETAKAAQYAHEQRLAVEASLAKQAQVEQEKATLSKRPGIAFVAGLVAFIVGALLVAQQGAAPLPLIVMAAGVVLLLVGSALGVQQGQKYERIKKEAKQLAEEGLREAQEASREAEKNQAEMKARHDEMNKAAEAQKAALEGAHAQKSAQLDEKVRALAAEKAALEKRIEANQAKADELQSAAVVFAGTYIGDGRPVRKALEDIRARAATYYQLTQKAEELKAQRARNEEELTVLETMLNGQFATWGLTQEGMPWAQKYDALQRAVADYTRLQASVAQSEEALAALKPRFEAAQSVVAHFRSTYAPAGSPALNDVEFIEAVKAVLQAYAHAKARLQEHARALTQHAEKVQALQDALTNFCTTYQLQATTEPAFFADVLSRVGKLESLTQRVAQVQQELQHFDEKHPEIAALDPKDYVPTEAGSVEELTQVERALIRQRDEIQQHLEEPLRHAVALQTLVDEIPALQEELENKKELLERSKQNAATYKSALAFLQEAQESLARKYLEPLNEALNKNLMQVFGESMSARIDDSLKVKVEVKGAFQESILLSAGQADLVDICLRMSLADVLYPEGHIFMILDDPFINLDDAHVREAFVLLERAAAEKQMVYLTCHTSRCPE